MATPPFILNLAPTPNELAAGLTNPIRFSIRDADTYIVPTSVKITVGYAQIKASGDQEFDKVLPRTTRSSVLAGTINFSTSPTIIHVSGGISITKTSSSNQPTVYVTKLDTGSGGFPSFIGTAVINPVTISEGQPGAVFGIENGIRNTGIFIFFRRVGGTPVLRICGPANSIGSRSPDTTIILDWTGAWRYIIIWNEITSTVDIYRTNDISTILIDSETIASFQTFDLVSGGTPKHGGVGDITLLYGIEGQSGEQTIIGNVAITNDVGFPIIGLTRTGEFTTLRRTDETVRYEGGNPLRSQISPWFGPDNKFFNSPDSSGSIKVLSSNTVRLTKLTSGSSMALYREEPSLSGSDSDGFMLEGYFFATPSQLISSKITGMGFFVFDGQSIYFLGLLSGTLRTVGLLRRGGDPSISSSYQIPLSNISWASPSYVRLVVDPRRGLIDLYDGDINTPKLSVPFDRAALPQASDFNLVGKNPIIAFGHIPDLDTLGSFELSKLTYACSYQAYEARDGLLPDDSLVNPIWTSEVGGTSPTFLPNPLFGLSLLSGGFGLLPFGLYLSNEAPPINVSTITNNQLVIETTKGITHIYSRGLAIDANRGAVVEFRLQITKHKARARTGFFVFIDDGVNTYALSFVDTEIGKFVCIPIRSGSGLIESLGTEGLGAKLSRQISWDDPHIYRLERRPLDGVYLFIDNHIDPTLKLLDSDKIDYPQSQFLTPTISFGHFSGEGAISLTDFVRVEVSEGYEISTKKVASTSQLEQNIINTQAIVVAIARDNDL